MVDCRFEIAVDRRERLAYTFEGIVSDKTSYGAGDRFSVATKRKQLHYGDYSIVGYSNLITVERKTVLDFIQSASTRHDWFDGKMARMNDLQYAAVVVEGTMRRCIQASKKPGLGKTLFRSVLAWNFRYQNVHWYFMDDRRDAEICTFRFLERYWKLYIDGA